MSIPLKIGILGGSFNPVHVGHIMLADYIAQFTDIDQVWFMLSPLNPLKADCASQIIDNHHRFEMLRIAIGENPRLRTCDIELSMPQPSYTINSLNLLSQLHPDCKFSLIIGSDNWLMFEKWREYKAILNHYSPIVYPRPGYDISKSALPTENITIVNAPTVDISSTFIRNAISQGKDMTSFLPPGVAKYIKDHNLYL